MIKTLSLSAIALATLGFNSAAHADISDFDSPRIYLVSVTVNILLNLKTVTTTLTLTTMHKCLKAILVLSLTNT